MTTAVKVTGWLTEGLAVDELKSTEVPDGPTCCMTGSEVLLVKAGSVLVKAATMLNVPLALNGYAQVGTFPVVTFCAGQRFVTGLVDVFVYRMVPELGVAVPVPPPVGDIAAVKVTT